MRKLRLFCFFLLFSIHSLLACADWLHSPSAMAASTFDWGGLFILSAGSYSVYRQVPQDRKTFLSIRTATHRPYRSILNVGEYFGTGAPSAAIILTQFFVNSDAALAHIVGLTYTIAAVEIIKAGVERERPNGRKHSFPSGHTAMAFATATNMAYFHPWYIGLPMLVFAGSVAYQRVYDRRHWLSDTVGGATLGILFARGAAGLRAKNTRFAALPGGGMVVWNHSF